MEGQLGAECPARPSFVLCSQSSPSPHLQVGSQCGVGTVTTPRSHLPARGSRTTEDEGCTPLVGGRRLQDLHSLQVQPSLSVLSPLLLSCSKYQGAASFLGKQAQVPVPSRIQACVAMTAAQGDGEQEVKPSQPPPLEGWNGRSWGALLPLSHQCGAAEGEKAERLPCPIMGLSLVLSAQPCTFLNVAFWSWPHVTSHLLGCRVEGKYRRGFRFYPPWSQIKSVTGRESLCLLAWMDYLQL